MRILIIGNNPHAKGGVVNYTRPLTKKFTELGHDVFYFYSGARDRRYNWLIRPYLKINKKDFPFEFAELINSPNWTHNFGHPLLDINTPQTEKLFTRYLEKIRPDVMHVHSRMGLPASIIEIASKRGIKVFNTIHVYGLLCQKRVMTDHNGMPCDGPSSLRKCAQCTGYINIKKVKFNARIENTNKNLLELLIQLKKKFARFKQNNKNTISQIGTTPNYGKTQEDLQKRRDYMVNLMNRYVVTNICVSTDVKRILMKYGVYEEKLLVQHIGSTIADTQKMDLHKLHHPLVIGNIGGVAYYKGTHILIDAINKVKNNNFIVKIFGNYEKDYVKEIMKGKGHLPIEFLGRYKHDDLPEILKQIDIMVLPSICNDTAPQTIFESYSAGIPILASNIGGFTDFVKDGKNGYLFKAGNSNDLAEKLDDILENREKIESFKNNIPHLKTITENAQELISLYKGCNYAVH